MMCGRMMFGEVIGLVLASRPPIDVILSLANTIPDPIKAHVDCFGAFLLDGVGEDADGRAVVCL